MFRISIIFSISFIFLIQACQKNYVLDIQESDSKIVVEGIISLQKGVEVYLNKTINIGDTVFYDNSNFINNARILVESNKLGIIDTLINVSNGAYISSKLEHINLDNEYKLKIENTDFGSVESEWISIPNNIVNFVSNINVTSENIFIEILFNKDEKNNEVNYTLGFLASEALNNIDFNSSSISSNNCISIFFPFRNFASLLDRSCFSSLESRYNSSHTYFGSIDGLEFNFGIISSIAYEYFNSINNQPTGIDQLITSPILLKSNIKGGVGIFAGYNEYTIPIK